MKDKKLNSISIIRQRAEEQLTRLQLMPDSKQMELDPLVLNHELLVHQIELELQNDELRQAIELRDRISEKYIELYNLAHLGYFTLTKEGEIIEVNLFGSKIFGKEQTQFENNRFGLFVTDESKPIFNLFFEKTFNTKVTECCMVSMALNDDILKHVLLTGNVTKNGEHCLLAVIDITPLVEKENKIKELEQFNNYFVGRELKMVELKKEINELLLKSGSEKRY